MPVGGRVVIASDNSLPTEQFYTFIFSVDRNPLSTQRAEILNMARRHIVRINTAVTVRVIRTIPSQHATQANRISINGRSFLLIHQHSLTGQPAINTNSRQTARMAHPTLFTGPTHHHSGRVISIHHNRHRVQHRTLTNLVRRQQQNPCPVIRTTGGINTLLARGTQRFQRPGIPTGRRASTTGQYIRRQRAHITQNRPRFFRIPRVHLTMLTSGTLEPSRRTNIRRLHTITFNRANSRMGIILTDGVRPTLRNQTDKCNL